MWRTAENRLEAPIAILEATLVEDMLEITYGSGLNCLTNSAEEGKGWGCGNEWNRRPRQEREREREKYRKKLRMTQRAAIDEEPRCILLSMVRDGPLQCRVCAGYLFCWLWWLKGELQGSSVGIYA
jgi:hypothetical protein